MSKEKKKEHKKHISLSKNLIIGTAILTPISKSNGGGGGGGEGGGSVSGGIFGGTVSMGYASLGFSSPTPTGSYSTSYSAYNGRTGQYADISMSINANETTFGVSRPSCPFLLTYDGNNFIHENDFLMGKPSTVFPNKKTGLKTYSKGIGGDTYLIQSEVKSNENGEIKMQIREIEPEESFIDRFEIHALDLAEGEQFITDGNLKDGYVFDSQKIKVSSQQSVYHYEAKQNTYKKVNSNYFSLKRPDKTKDLTLMTGDELLIRIPKEALDIEQDNFILVDSHYRDWSLGNQVPFSRLESFMISSQALGRQTVLAMTGVAVVATGLFTSNYVFDKDLLNKLTSIPYTYADTPHWGRGGGNRSLVVSVSDGISTTYLQTLFPRYVRASQEVVRIPREIVKNLKESFLTVRIKATKKHKVKTSFVFSGEAKAPRLKKLELIEAKRQSDSVDFSKKLQKKNSDFLQTLPGDVIDLTLQDTPKEEGKERRYVLKSNGFYTRLSKEGYRKIGKNWLSRLASEDRKLLKNLRLS